VEDEDGNIWAMPVILIDPTTGNTIVAGQGILLRSSSTPSIVARVAAHTPIQTLGTINALDVVSLGMASDGVNWNPINTPLFFKSAQATAAGSTALWTPTAGKHFQLMGGVIMLSKEAACAGAEYVELLDAAASIGLRWDFSTAALVAMGQCVVIPFDLKPCGYYSAAANNVLNIKLNGALTAGNCSVSCWGVEQ